MQKLPVILSEILLPLNQKTASSLVIEKQFGSWCIKGGQDKSDLFHPLGLERESQWWIVCDTWITISIIIQAPYLCTYILTTTNTKKPYHLDLADLVCLGSGKGTYSRVLNRRQFRIKLKTVWKRMFLYKWPLYDLFWPFFCHVCVYLSQKWGSDGHFELLNGSESWFGQKLWPQM